METEKKINEISWTWADQISSYKFWGIFLFYIFLLIPNMIINYSFSLFRESLNLNAAQIGTALGIKSFAGLAGFWLAWFMVRSKNHFIIFLYSAFIIIGLLLILLIPSVISLSIGFFLIGLGFGAITLAIPTIIAGGRGGSEMFVVSFGLITFFEVVAWTSSSGLIGSLSGILNNPKLPIIIAIISSLIGTILLIPVKSTLFNCSPPERKFSLTPTFREPFVLVLLCLIPLYNIYYIIYLSYRFHGEVNSINPTQNILSPRAAAWCTLFLSVVAPIITCSLNSNLIPKITDHGKPTHYRNWSIILWSFIFVPISYALIQSNMNKIINQDVK